MVFKISVPEGINRFIRSHMIAELCRRFNNLVKSPAPAEFSVIVYGGSFPQSDQLITISPPKERRVEDDMFVLSPTPSLFSSLSKPPKWSDGTPVLMKFQAECHHHIFEAAIKPSYVPIRRPKRIVDLRTANTSLIAKASTINNGTGTMPRCVVLDIEGTTTPITFVTEVLFPYARDNVRMHLEETYDTADTKDDIMLLRSQIEDDLQNGVMGAVPVPSDDAGKEEVIAALVANVEEMIKADRKITSLKQLQGHIWRTGFEKNEIKGVVYDDVPQALERWHASGVKVYIYSSGSRLAQRLIFGYTNYGDLRKYLCGFFDTRVGNKRETNSYIEISESLGVDKPSDVLFVTDVVQEAVAAKAAGLQAVISVRPGNGPLPENHGFDMIETFTEIPF